MARIIYENGLPFIEINGEKLPPAAFRSFRPKPDNISLMTRAGVKLCQMLVSGLDLTPVITHHFKVDDFQKGFDIMESGQCGKVILEWE